MNKKITSLILALLIALNCFCFVSADTNASQIQVSAIPEATGLLAALGIIDGGIELSETVTRADAAYYISRMLNQDVAQKSYRGVFSDVPASHARALEIECLADLGIIRGDSKFTYRPDDSMTYREAACMFSMVLGYGITGNVYEKAYEYMNRNDIFDGVEAAYDYVNYQDFWMMMYNALHSRVLEQVSYGVNREYDMSDDDLLYKNFGVLYSYGTVVKNELTYLWSSQSGNEDTIILEMDSSELEIDITKTKPDTRALLGRYVTIYYHPDTAMRRLDYVYHITENEDKIYNVSLSQLDLSDSDIENGTLYVYDEQNKKDTVRLSDECALIYNNAAYKSHTIDFSSLKDKVGTLELIDYDSNKKYDVVKLNVYDTVIVGGVSENHLKITDKFSSKSTYTINVNEDDYTKIFIYDALGNELKLSDIEPEDVLSVAVSVTYSGDNVLEILVSKDTVTGSITEISDNSYEKKIVIDYNNEYILADRATKGAGYAVGSYMLGYIDVFGNLVYISDDYGRDMQYGLVIGTGYDSNGFNNDVKVKLRTLSGDFEILSLAENVIIDGESYKDSQDKAYKRLQLADTQVESIGTLDDIYIIRYKKDADGALKIIDTTLEGKGGTKDSLELMIAGEYLIDGQCVIGWQVPISPDANVMRVAVSDFKDASLYEEETAVFSDTLKNAFKNTSILDTSAAYRSNPDTPYADLVIKFDESSLVYDDEFFVVDLVKYAYNKDKDENMYKIEGVLNGVAKIVWMDEKGTTKKISSSSSSFSDELKNATRGDVIRCVTDANDRIVSYEYIYQRDTETFTKPANATDPNPKKSTSLSVVSGYVYSKTGNFITLAYVAPGAVPDLEDIDFESATLLSNILSSTASVTVVDDSDKTVKSGTIDDVLDYERYATEGSFIITRYRSNTLREIVIYNE